MNCGYLESREADMLGCELTDRSECERAGHFVQFYERDSYLTKRLAVFVGAGLEAGDAGLVIATAAHRAALDKRLRKRGLDLHGLRASGQYRALDAAQTLAAFMKDGSPDPERFTKVVGSLVAQACHSGRHLRAFGEMVALLWADGNRAAAIELEHLWNRLAKEQSLMLLCAYPMNGFSGESNLNAFAKVCDAHSRVFPTEWYVMDADVTERLRRVSLLQQKASSLELEVFERRQAEQKLARREKELTDLLENASEAIHQVGADGTILWANRAELELLGYTAEEYIGHPIVEFHADSERIEDVLKRLKSGEQLVDYEARLRCRDGSIRHVAINSSVCWEGDRFLYTRCFTRDITERKRAAEILERTIAERTAELRQTVAELEAFSYSISHDLRTPLRSMRGYAQLLLGDCADKLDPEHRTYLEKINASAEAMDRLIQDVLAFTRTARASAELEPVNLDHLLRGILECYPILQAPAAEIVVQRKLPVVIGNAAMLTQCLSNLLSNAVKFVAPDTQPIVHVWSETVSADAVHPDRKAKWLRLYIRDNGIGIPEEAHQKIFGAFHRLSRSYEGTGLGLAIVQKGIERMGGKVGVQSAEGKGSTFWIELRLADQQRK